METETLPEGGETSDERRGETPLARRNFKQELGKGEETEHQKKSTACVRHLPRERRGTQHDSKWLRRRASKIV